MARLLHWILAVATGFAWFLTFAWPFVVSADPADARFRVLAICTFVVVLAAIAALAFLRLRRTA